ncbi:MAG: N-acetyltransferase [Bacteroidota bacterium]
MIFSPENIIIRELVSSDFDALLYYLYHLSAETKSRFGPHAFNPEAVIQFYNSNDVTGFVAADTNNNLIIAYSIIKEGILHHDRNRLSAYQYANIENNCCTYAPSVADNWQGKGIGKLMFDHILNHCRQKLIRRIILWGGVQATNEKALHFYKKLGFVRLGQFEYNGLNQDMLLEI